jgi:hypothetical protein
MLPEADPNSKLHRVANLTSLAASAANVASASGSTAVLEYRPTETLALLFAGCLAPRCLSRPCGPASPPKWRKTGAFSERDGLSAGGNRIRTIGPSLEQIVCLASRTVAVGEKIREPDGRKALLSHTRRLRQSRLSPRQPSMQRSAHIRLR